MKYVVYGSLALVLGAAILVIPYIHTHSQLASLLAHNTTLMKQVQQYGLLQADLVVGSTGFEVTVLQAYLSTYPEVYPEAEVTGYFGPLTQTAVARYQSVHILPVTGVMDTPTRTLVNYSLVTELCPHVPTAPGTLLKMINRAVGFDDSYVPKNLRLLPKEIPTVGIACVQAEVIAPLLAMVQVAKQADVSLIVTSAYRPFLIQEWLLRYWINLEGEGARAEVAEPGHSEHHLGTVIDFSDSSINNVGASPLFASSVGGVWLQENAHTYGFTLSYPKDREAITGYTYEPWHWRYVGMEVATELHRTGRTLSEYLNN